MNELEKVKKAYEEVIEVLEKNQELCLYDISDLKRRAEKHIFGLELKHKYGLNIEPQEINYVDFYNDGRYRFIGMFGEKHKRTISASDDRKQPKDELLLQISFPTGAYIFGEDYPEDLFDRLFSELKEYKPKYCDTINSKLYYPIESAKEVFNNFNDILSKYKNIYKQESKQREIEEMEKKLNKLK